MTERIDRIARTFARILPEGGAALIPYIAAGDPGPDATVPLMHALADAGADIIELGIPFSDPMADGPVIQRAAERAIAGGTGLSGAMSMVAEFRTKNQDTPVVLMGYANPIERMGQETFVERAAQAGVDGVLVVDYPPEEVETFAAALNAVGISPIFLLAPTSSEQRMRSIGAVAKGYVYYVSLKGVTGAANIDTTEVGRRVAEIRQHVNIPVGVGFGIGDAQSASRVAQIADAVVIGSKLIDTIDQAVRHLPTQEKAEAAATAGATWLASIRTAMDASRRKPSTH